MSIAEPTYQQLFNLAKAAAQAKRAEDGKPQLAFNAGDLSEMTIAASAAMGAHVAAYAADRFLALTTDGQGDDLTALALDRWQIVRVAAAPARVVLTLSRSGTAAGSQAAGSVVSSQPDESGAQQQFTLDSQVNWTLGDLGPKTVNATCTVNGADGNVAAGTITRLVTTPFDATITCTNAAAAAGGSLEQNDDSLRSDVRAFPAAMREATLDALAYHLGQLAGIANVSVIEEIVGGFPTGIVDVYVSDVNGAMNDALLSTVLAEVVLHRAAGSIVNVHAGSTVNQAIDVSLVLAAGLTPATAAALAADVQAAIVAGVNRTGQGQLLERAAIARFGVNVDPDSIRSLTVNTPPTDVQPAASVAIRISAGDVSVH